MTDTNDTPDPTGADAATGADGAGDIVIDVIPDVHGQARKLEAALAALGYRERDGAWRHDAPRRTALFLGDLIDGKPGYAPEEARTLGIARAMMEAGTALCLMGNHELNAIHFHTTGSDGAPLRPHCKKNRDQHAAFLAEHPLGSDAAREAIAWMETLPVAIEAHGLRATHACWSEDHIAVLRAAGETREVPGGTAIHLSSEALHAAAGRDVALHEAVEVVLKSPEFDLPDGRSFRDKDGNERHAVRLKWWERALTWREAAMSVPDGQASNLPDADLPPGAAATIYPPGAPPVVFGHYWMAWPHDLPGAPDAPRPHAPNALCLDFSAGKDGPLVTYAHVPGTPLDASGLHVHHDARQLDALVRGASMEGPQ